MSSPAAPVEAVSADPCTSVHTNHSGLLSVLDLAVAAPGTQAIVSSAYQSYLGSGGVYGGASVRGVVWLDSHRLLTVGPDESGKIWELQRRGATKEEKPELGESVYSLSEMHLPPSGSKKTFKHPMLASMGFLSLSATPLSGRSQSAVVAGVTATGMCLFWSWPECRLLAQLTGEPGQLSHLAVVPTSSASADDIFVRCICASARAYDRTEGTVEAVKGVTGELSVLEVAVDHEGVRKEKAAVIDRRTHVVWRSPSRADASSSSAATAVFEWAPSCLAVSDRPVDSEGTCIAALGTQGGWVVAYDIAADGSSRHRLQKPLKLDVALKSSTSEAANGDTSQAKTRARTASVVRSMCLVGAKFLVATCEDGRVAVVSLTLSQLGQVVSVFEVASVHESLLSGTRINVLASQGGSALNPLVLVGFGAKPSLVRLGEGTDLSRASSGEIACLRDSKSAITCAAFSPDGYRVAVCGSDGVLRVAEVPVDGAKSVLPLTSPSLEEAEAPQQPSETPAEDPVAHEDLILGSPQQDPSPNESAAAESSEEDIFGDALAFSSEENEDSDRKAKRVKVDGQQQPQQAH